MAIDAGGRLRALRNADGGYPPVAGVPSEPEPTALAALALDDAGARKWLEDRQRNDGGWILGPDALRNDSATPLAAIALAPGQRSDLAVDYLVSHRGQALANDPRFPHDPNTRGWGWTSATFGWVEPTAHGLLALRLLRPSVTNEIADAHRLLEDRECSVGGWNYGNREVLGVQLEPYLQTTAAAVIALQDPADPLVTRGVAVIERLWNAERGGLGLAMALAGLRLVGQASADVEDGLTKLVTDTDLLQDGVSLGWAAIALGPALERLRVQA